MRKAVFTMDSAERERFLSENTSVRREMYHSSPSAWRKERGLEIQFPKPTPEQIARAMADYEEYIDIP